MQPLLNLHTWVTLPNEVRFKISSIFKIPKTGSVLVNDNVVETDGTTIEDIAHLTVEKMQVYLKSEETDFHKLFDLVVAQIREEIWPTPKVDVVEAPRVVEEPVAPIIINANTNTNGTEAPKEGKQVKKGNRK